MNVQEIRSIIMEDKWEPAVGPTFKGRSVAQAPDEFLAPGFEKLYIPDTMLKDRFLDVRVVYNIAEKDWKLSEYPTQDGKLFRYDNLLDDDVEYALKLDTSKIEEEGEKKRFIWFEVQEGTNVINVYHPGKRIVTKEKPVKEKQSCLRQMMCCLCCCGFFTLSKKAQVAMFVVFIAVGLGFLLKYMEEQPQWGNVVKA